MRSRLLASAALAVGLQASTAIAAPATAGQEENFLAPQSVQAVGDKRVLMVGVRFADVQPSKHIEEVRKRVVIGLNNYVREQSYGRASVTADFRGWIPLPDSLSRYAVSPYNFKVDRSRVRKLIEDTLTAIEPQIDFSGYDHILIIPGAHTMPGQGYGMLCYCANPGMLSGVSRRYVPRYETLRSKGGREFSGGVFVGAENAHLGMFAHDYFHALGGVQDGKRLAPCLYDFRHQSDESAGLPTFEHNAIYMGPWDIMSQHFVRLGETSPGLSSFTKIRLGWITTREARLVKPGETALVFLSPLSRKGETLVVKIPLAGGRHYLVENRQPIGSDRVLPDSGVLILKVNPDADEGFGTVELVNADPKAYHFSRATFRIEEQARNRFVDARNGVAILPLWTEKDELGVLVTTPNESEAALKAAQGIRRLMARPQADDAAAALREALAAFRKFDFPRSHQIARAIVGDD